MKYALALVLIFLASCSEVAYFNEPDVNYLVVSNEYAAIEDDISVLILRLKAVSPSVISGIKSRKHNDKRSIVFTRGSPSAETIKFLSINRGKFSATDDKGNVLFTDKGIINSSATIEGGGTYIDISLSEQVVTYLTENLDLEVGNLVHFSLDGERVMTVKFRDYVSRHMRISAKDENHAKLISAILRYGALSRSLQLKNLNESK